MFLELIATFAAAIGAAGIVMLINRFTGGALPKWAMPVAAGATMILFSIWSEYSWARRTAEGLPEGTMVIQRIEDSAWWKPWTYIKPQATRMIVLDKAGIQTNAAAPDTRLIEIYILARWRAPARVAQLIDCTAYARADVTDGALADPASAAWITLSADDPMITHSCQPSD